MAKIMGTNISTAGVPDIGMEGTARVEKIENGLLVTISKDVRQKNGEMRYISKKYFAKTENDAKAIIGKAL